MLKAFAEDMTVETASKIIRVSDRTIEALYSQFRDAVMRCAMMQPMAFGGVGYFLFDDLEMSPRGKVFADVFSGSALFRRALNRHMPRVGLGSALKPDFSFLLVEVIARVFCALAHPKDNETLYAPEIHEAYANLQLVALYIHQQKDAPEDPELFAATLESFERIMADFPKLLVQEEVVGLVTGAKHHHFAADVFYTDLRTYLRQNPLGSGSEGGKD